MKIFKLFITSLMVTSAMFVSASNHFNNTLLAVSSTPVEQTKSNETIIKEWENLYDKYTPKYDSILNADEKAGKKMPKEDFEKYKKSCQELKTAIEIMNQKDFKTPINFNFDEWCKYSENFKDVLKSDLKKIVEKGSDDVWVEKYNALIDVYNKMIEAYDNEKFDYAISLIDENNAQKETIAQLKNDIYALKAKLNSTSAELNTFKTDKTDFGTGLQKAFEVCVFFPLAVKCNKDYVAYARLAASEIISSDKGSIAPAMKDDWKKYEPLLVNYGKYNDALIDYVNKQKVALTGKTINADGVDYYKKDIEFSDKYPILKEYFTKYYKKDVNIPYLDKAIDEFFNILNSFAKSGKELNEKVFDNFTNIHLR